MKRICFGALMVLMLVNCSNEEIYIGNDENPAYGNEVKLLSSIAGMTSRLDLTDQLYSFPNGTKSIVAYMDIDGGTEGTKRSLQAGENGVLTFENKALEYPTDGSTVSFYSFWPNKSGTIFGYEGNSYIWQLAQKGETKYEFMYNTSNEYTQTGNNNTLSELDVMIAVARNIIPTNSYVQLKYYHMFSNISVALKAGEGVTKGELQNMKIVIDMPKAKVFVDFNKANLINWDNYEQRKSVLSPNGNASNYKYTIDTYVTDEFGDYGNYGRAIVTPRQTVSSGRDFIFIYDSNGNEVAKYTLSANLDVYTGYRYIFNLTVTKPDAASRAQNCLSIDAEGVVIQDWNTGEILERPKDN